jgi:orotate phosphoribosyltransferase
VELVPTQQDVIGLLRRSGALREGHFSCPTGIHTNQYLEPALAMRYHCHAKTLSVGLSRLIRSNAELRAILHELSIVAATPGGLPVAYGLCEALRARQVYWAERSVPGAPLGFRQFLDPAPGERVILVDDMLRAGVILEEVRRLLENRGARVLALAVLVYQPTPMTREAGDLLLYSLARLDAQYYTDPAGCELCRQGVPLELIGRESLEQAIIAHASAGAR